MKPVSLITVLALAGALPAQDNPFVPAEQVQKFAGLIGTWQGKGVARAPEAPDDMPWTSRHSFSWVLGGHFVREHVVIDFGETLPEPLQMENYLGWDRENKRYVSISANNMGIVELAEVHWVGDAMVQSNSMTANGQVMVDRWVTRLKDGEMLMHGMRAIDAGDFFSHVEGTATRTSDKPAESEWVDASFMVMHDLTPMQNIRKMAGTYELAGSMVPAPGMPEMKITGTETLSMIFDGTVLRMVTAGDPVPEMPGPNYEAIGFIGWNPSKNCYATAGLSNMGHVGLTDGWWQDGSLVTVFAGPDQGQPTAMRNVIKVGDDGAITEVTVHSLSGTAAPQRVFHAEYRKVE